MAKGKIPFSKWDDFLDIAECPYPHLFQNFHETEWLRAKQLIALCYVLLISNLYRICSLLVKGAPHSLAMEALGTL